MPTHSGSAHHRIALALLLSLGPFSWAHAHDTWLSPLVPKLGSPMRLALGTGNRFPVLEFNPRAISLAEAGCRSATGQPVALLPDAEAATHLVLRTRAASDASPARTCWAQLKAFELSLPADKVAEYFREIRPTEAVQQAWRDMQQRGVVWQERYTKYARIELPLPPGVTAPSPEASPLGMDALLLTPAADVRPGATVEFVVLRDGRPLADFPVELVNERQPLGIWRKTDGQGRIAVALPLTGLWLLRGTDLALSSTEADRWESRFLTLAFEVRAPR